MQGRSGKERTSPAERCTTETACLATPEPKQSKDGWLSTQHGGIAPEQRIEVPLNSASKNA